MYGSLFEDSAPLVLFNTGTFFDLMAGTYTIGTDGKFYLNGGYGSFIIGMHGRGNTYKSTLSDSLTAGVLMNYDDAKCINYDTEHSKSKARILKFMRSARTKDYEIGDRIVVRAGGEFTLKKVWDEIKKICEIREKNKKALMVQSPFQDYYGKPIMVWQPLIVVIDTFSELKTAAEHDKLDGDIEDKKNKTVYMNDGNAKTMMLSALNKYCGQYGITLITTAHTGDNFSMDERTPPAKQLLFQKQKDKIKGVGSKFDRLTHVLAQIASCHLCIDSNKKALYSYGGTANTDLQELQVITSRNKINGAGTMVPFIVSQEYGLLNEVTYLHYLRTKGYSGLTKGASAPRNSCSWLPDVNFSRNDVREQFMQNYPLCRAIELVAKYRYIQESWNISKLPVDFSRSPEEVFDKLTNTKSIQMADILETTSRWTYGKSDREVLTLFDILGEIK